MARLPVLEAPVGLLWRVLPALLFAAAGCGSSSPPPTPADGCIDTPQEYAAAWAEPQFDVFECVSPDLYVTVTSGPRLYPDGFWYAWANSRTNLEKYLEIRKLYRDDPSRVTLGIMSYLGFPVWTTYPQEDVPAAFVVYTLPRGQRALVPSFETWFHLIEEEFDLVVPLGAQKDLLLAYSRIKDSNIEKDNKSRDVVDAYTKVTGCEQTEGLSFSTRNGGNFLKDDLAGCDEDYREVLRVIGDTSVDPVGLRATRLGGWLFRGSAPTGDSGECFRRLREGYEGELSASASRAALHYCQDVNALNTGVGLGYNRNENPFVCKPLAEQSVSDRYTGREFILPNFELARLNQVSIPLEALGDSPFAFLETGYCE